MTKIEFIVDNEDISFHDAKCIIAWRDPYIAISEIKSFFKTSLKYGYIDSKEMTAEQMIFLEKIQDKIWELCEEVIDD